jgi:putative NIF3 family GTP cyclohydrolase 1 type 2
VSKCSPELAHSDPDFQARVVAVKPVKDSVTVSPRSNLNPLGCCTVAHPVLAWALWCVQPGLDNSLLLFHATHTHTHTTRTHARSLYCLNLCAQYPRAGDGRIITLPEPLPLSVLIARVKAFLGLDHVQVSLSDKALGGQANSSAAVLAAAPGVMVASVGVCAGSGRSVLAGCAADVWLTGEMAHHDCVLAASEGVSVIVTNHTNTERGYLPHLAGRLEAALGLALPGHPVTVLVTAVDADPLVTV